MNNKQEFEQILENHPELTTHGFGVDKQWGESFETEREHIFDCYEAYKVSCMYLAADPRLDKAMTSYNLKHAVERWAKKYDLETQYIPEGAFVAAVIGMKLPYERVEDTPHLRLK